VNIRAGVAVAAQGVGGAALAAGVYMLFGFAVALIAAGVVLVALGTAFEVRDGA
jgi:hypothetical protein